MHAVYLNRFLNMVVASLSCLQHWRKTEMHSMIQKRYAQKPKNPV